MKTILLPIHPEWNYKIFSGEKKTELRKVYIEPPFKVCVYETLGRVKSKEQYFVPKPYGKDDLQWFYAHEGSGKVIGEFIVDEVDKYAYDYDPYNDKEKMYYITSGEGALTCLSYAEIEKYGQGKTLYGYHITAPKLYERPRELPEFKKAQKCHYANLSGGAKCYPENCDKCGYLYEPVTRAPQSFMYIQDPEEYGL